MEYSIGQLSRISGSSEKAIRIYQKKGLLTGRRNESNQYRVFDEGALIELQRIQMLKFLGFSLEQIKSFTEHFEELSIENSLRTQKRMLEQKRERLDSMISCVERGVNECVNKSFAMDEFFERLNHIRKNRMADEGVWKLNRLADEPKGWSQWVFTEANLYENMKILDAGAGWGNLWRYNRDKIKNKMHVTCIDRHNTHADSFATYLQEEQLDNFTFLFDDLETMLFDDTYDRIFLNHVIQFIHEPVSLYKRFRKILTKQGIFMCTWGGLLQFQELRDLLRDFPNGVSYFTERYTRMMGKLKQREEELRQVFSSVECRKYCLHLQYASEEELADYIISLVRGEIWTEQLRSELIQYLTEKMNGQELYLKRDTYLYLCKEGE